MFHQAVARFFKSSFFAALAAVASAVDAGAQTNVSFVDDFNRFDLGRWYVADGWANGDWQNCTWSKRQIALSEGVLSLSFEKRPYGLRNYVCGEIQTHHSFHYGTYEARMKTDTGSGINAAFFTYIGPVHNKPHDEIDFEVLTKDTSSVSVNTYVSGQPKNGGVVPVEGGTDAGFNDYAFVWEPDRLRWYVNGELMHEAENTAELPTNAQKIYFSIWGTETLNDWMGPFEDPGRKLFLYLDRVAFTVLGDDCQFPESIVCTLD